jgi:hypothetical protein
MVEKMEQSTIQELQNGRYLVNLSDDIKEIPDENNTAEGYNFAIDDEEWGNDF